MGDLTNIDLLNYAIENDMIDINSITQQIEMSKREKYLEMQEYKIWQGKKDKKWYTYLPDESKGRRLIKKTTKESLEDEVINYYKTLEKIKEDSNKRKAETLVSIFPKWIQFKWKHTNSSSYIKRITADWSKFYKVDPDFINTPLIKLTTVQLDEWAHDIIKNYTLTKKAYYNMSIILRQCLDYAVELGIIDDNVFKKVKINSKIFNKKKKKSGETEVYTVEEEQKFVIDMIRRFNNNPKSTAPLAVTLIFEIGVRIGELCALKFSDIEGDYIHIQRQEVREYKMINEYEMRFKEFSIAEYTKTDDSDRFIYLTNAARSIIDYVKMINKKNGESNNGFIFVENGRNINHYSIQALIVRGCEFLKIPVKTSHKMRKTYISTLIDSGLNIDEIRRFAGHSDERTTYGNYCYNRLTNKQTEDLVENALNSKKVIKGNQIWKVYGNEEMPILQGKLMAK